MRFTDYQSKYFAYELTRRAASNSLEKLTSAVAGAQVDLNPHQVDAALFAFKSPLSKGALLADEVGLGKTIEAGLVLSQHWAERKRNLLVIVPASLRKQWYQELTEKFFLPCEILETKNFNQAIRNGNFRPFDTRDAIVICSYPFAKMKAGSIANTPWDLVVIDEAHRLRNVYQSSKVTANTIKRAIGSRKKLLLTATPLQNSLLELYGLVSIIDEHIFGDVQSFREQFMGTGQNRSLEQLRTRLQPICTRTLRRQVSGYVSYTKRLPLVEEFTPDESEDTLYELVTEYLARPNLQALGSGQRKMITMTLQKLLASSTFAIAGALNTMSQRLKRSIAGGRPERSLDDELAEDFESLDEVRDEWSDEHPAETLSPAERQAIEAEIRDLDAFVDLALSIETNAKGDALLQALTVGMGKMAELGAEQKAIIFTESRKTQDYLLRVLAGSPWRDGIVLFNGSNSDPGSRAIYDRWLKRHQGSDRVTGSRTADMRSALVDYFRDEGRIMIATEAAAEGINLQFCSLVVNYDLPWNPQRIEQRIGRCHRYGQKHDVVVVNFLNRKNEADQRVFELLSEKFKLFEGVFGASDEVLGSIESGIDFERRISEIYQNCRKPDEINEAFQQLRMQLAPEITVTMAATRQKLIENFDVEVNEKLRLQKEASEEALSRFERLLMRLTQHELADHAIFYDHARFLLRTTPFGPTIETGLYELPRRNDDAHVYRLTHPLAEAVVNCAKSRETPPAEVIFNLHAFEEGRVAVLEPYVGRCGQLAVSLLTIESLSEMEEHLILAAESESGEELDAQTIGRLLRLPARIGSRTPFMPALSLEAIAARRQADIQAEVAERNEDYFNAEAAKLDDWSGDLKVNLDRELDELNSELKRVKKEARLASGLEATLAGQRRAREIEAQIKTKRKSLFDAQDDIDQKRDALIAEIESSLAQRTAIEPLFTIKWALE